MSEMWVGFALTIGTILFTTGVVYGALKGEIRMIKYRLSAIEGTLKLSGFKFPHVDMNPQI